MKSSAFNELSEALRYEYLQAMGITQWVPRTEEVDSEEAYADQVTAKSSEAVVDHSETDLKPASAEGDMSTAVESIISEANQKENKPKAETRNDASLPVSSESQVSSMNNTDQNFAGTEQSVAEKTSAVKHFLKVVSWGETHDGEQTVMIICRHQKDQPAQSFARANSPSQFMLDYIQAFKEILGDSYASPRMHLSHLSQAGLGQDCQQMEEVMAQVTPNCVLLLGDETVAELLGPEANVVNQRGQRLFLSEATPALVSYHPFSLIENPQLKPLALEDLKLLGSVLKA